MDSGPAQDEHIPLVDVLRMAGVNHKTASVALREKLAICEEVAPEAMDRLRNEFQLNELVALSTCNRTEFYWTSSKQVDPERLFRSLLDIDSEGSEDLSSSIYSGSGRDVATHLFQVACGMDSLVLGETQIASQVKKAYEQSRERNFTGHPMNALFQKAFQITKRVYTYTSLTSQGVSIPSVALEFAEAIFDDLSGMFVVVIGTGEMARLTFGVLRQRGAHKVAFVTRSSERAREWGTLHEAAEVTTMEKITEVLGRADIVVACTSTDRPVVTSEHVRKALSASRRPNRPLLILDLGIPRNIDPGVGDMEQVFLHNIDDLEKVVERNRARLEVELVKARGIVKGGLEDYLRECRAATAATTIHEIRSFAQDIAAMELERTMKRISHLSERDKEEVTTAVHRILGKILHPPSENLRMVTKNGGGDEAISWARKLFGLDPILDPEEPEKPKAGHSGFLGRKKS